MGPRDSNLQPSGYERVRNYLIVEQSQSVRSVVLTRWKVSGEGIIGYPLVGRLPIQRASRVSLRWFEETHSCTAEALSAVGRDG